MQKKKTKNKNQLVFYIMRAVTWIFSRKKSNFYYYTRMPDSTLYCMYTEILCITSYRIFRDKIIISILLPPTQLVDNFRKSWPNYLVYCTTSLNSRSVCVRIKKFYESLNHFELSARAKFSSQLFSLNHSFKKARERRKNKYRRAFNVANYTKNFPQFVLILE